MALPVLSHPTFDLTIPSSKEKVVYRPFLVKEEKILLLAQEANEVKDLTRSVKQIINNFYPYFRPNVPTFLQILLLIALMSFGLVHSAFCR